MPATLKKPSLTNWLIALEDVVQDGHSRPFLAITFPPLTPESRIHLGYPSRFNCMSDHGRRLIIGSLTTILSTTDWNLSPKQVKVAVNAITSCKAIAHAVRAMCKRGSSSAIPSHAKPGSYFFAAAAVYLFQVGYPVFCRWLSKSLAMRVLFTTMAVLNPGRWTPKLYQRVRHMQTSSISFRIGDLRGKDAISPVFMATEMEQKAGGSTPPPPTTTSATMSSLFSDTLSPSSTSSSLFSTPPSASSSATSLASSRCESPSSDSSKPRPAYLSNPYVHLPFRRPSRRSKHDNTSTKPPPSLVALFILECRPQKPTPIPYVFIPKTRFISSETDQGSTAGTCRQLATLIEYIGSFRALLDQIHASDPGLLEQIIYHYVDKKRTFGLSGNDSFGPDLRQIFDLLDLGYMEMCRTYQPPSDRSTNLQDAAVMIIIQTIMERGNVPDVGSKSPGMVPDAWRDIMKQMSEFGGKEREDF